MSQMLLFVGGECDGDLVLTLDAGGFPTWDAVEAKFTRADLLCIVNSWIGMKQTQVRSGRKQRQMSQQMRDFWKANHNGG